MASVGLNVQWQSRNSWLSISSVFWTEPGIWKLFTRRHACIIALIFQTLRTMKILWKLPTRQLVLSPPSFRCSCIWIRRTAMKTHSFSTQHLLQSVKTDTFHHIKSRRQLPAEANPQKVGSMDSSFRESVQKTGLWWNFVSDKDKEIAQLQRELRNAFGIFYDAYRKFCRENSEAGKPTSETPEMFRQWFISNFVSCVDDATCCHLFLRDLNHEPTQSIDLVIQIIIRTNVEF